MVGQLNISFGICGVKSVVGEKSTNVNKKGDTWPFFLGPPCN